MNVKYFGDDNVDVDGIGRRSVDVTETFSTLTHRYCSDGLSAAYGPLAYVG